MVNSKPILYTVADVGRRVGLTPAAIRQAEARGRIEALARTVNGVRLFGSEEVERFVLSRRPVSRVRS